MWSAVIAASGMRILWSVMLRSRWIILNLPNPGAGEKQDKWNQVSVPRTGTGALAEKAKVCKCKLGKGNRQFSGVTLGQAMPFFCKERSQ